MAGKHIVRYFISMKTGIGRKRPRSVLVLPALAFLLFLYPVTSEALGRDSTLERLSQVKKAVVYIKAENAVLARKPNIAVLNPVKTGLLILKRARAATFDRKGAGVIIDPSGLIITNAHTVRDAGRILAASHDGSIYEAKLLRIADDDDLAFLGINPVKPLTPVAFSDSNTARLGNVVYTIGGSNFSRDTISQGKITGLGKRAKRKGSNRYSIELLQTDLNLHKGDSGGPLLDKKGRLLGLLFATRNKRPHLSFAIPSNRIKQEYLRFISSLSKP